jgi:hypothetical protein
MLGFGAQAFTILLDLNSAFIWIVVKLVQDLAGCESAKEVESWQHSTTRGEQRDWLQTQQFSS